MTQELYKWTPGRKPLIISVPHAGIFVPEDIAQTLTPAAKAVPDTDWHVDHLYTAAMRMGCAMLAATHSRFVVDLNRDPSGAALYPGASNTELCPVTTFASEAIYLQDRQPDAFEIERRVRAYWQPYHARLAAEIETIKARHGFCILIDAHSIRSCVPRFFAGTLPDLNLGTADDNSCVHGLAAKVFEVLAAAPGFTAVHNGRFKGGYITRHYGRPTNDAHALQIEIGQCCYMDEDNPQPYDAAASAPLRGVLGSVTALLLDWQPPLGAGKLPSESDNC
jgi:N-formylglutamate deformylase